MKKFEKKYLRYRHRYEWLEIFVEPDSKMIYSNLRSMLSIEPKFRNFGIEVGEYQQHQQAKSAENLNIIGLGIAGLALAAAVLDQPTLRLIASGVLVLALIGLKFLKERI
jgi:hypothetical protein